ncbi:MAG: DUF6484 domain-containing protein [Planctomycetes bacterium]|nr:DUF6484 domain-containing protein [Planctomycetota bacterium]
MRVELRNQLDFPLTEALLETHVAPPRIDGIVIGVLSGFTSAGLPCVEYPGNAGGERTALSTVALASRDQGREVALMFESGEPSKPIILGLIHHPVPIPTTVEVVKDKEHLVLEGKESIELRCGKSSITLTKAGKIILRGEYVLSRSNGVNRIKGGSVQIN